MVFLTSKTYRRDGFVRKSEEMSEIINNKNVDPSFGGRGQKRWTNVFLPQKHLWS